MEQVRERMEPSPNLTPADQRRSSEHTLARSQYLEIPTTALRRDVDQETDAGGLVEYWRILRRHKGIWIVFAFLGALIGLLVALPQTPVYQARASVEIIGLNENFLNLRQASPVTETGSGAAIDIGTQIKILQSEYVIDRVIHRLMQSGAAEPEASSRISAWRKALNPAEPLRADILEQEFRKMAKSLKVHSAGQTRILEVTVDSTSAQLAAEFANTLGSEFIEQNLESRWKTTERTSNWLSGQLDEMRGKLQRSEDALQKYARNSKLIFMEEKTNVSEDKLRQLQQELSSAQADRIAKQSRYEMAQTTPPDALPDVLNDPTLRETQSKITELRRQAAELGTTYTPESAKAKRVQAQISTLESAFEHERAAILDRIRNEHQEAERREKLLAAAYDAQTRLVTGQGEKVIQYNILKREVDSNRKLYETMLQQLKESTIASAMRASNIRILDSAKVPLHPYKPDPTQSSAFGLLTGIFMGAAFIVMRERTDRTIQQPGDSSLYVNLPELGVIPSFNLQSSLAPRTLDKIASHPFARVELVTWQSKPSIVAESFRSVLLSILFTDEAGSRPKVLVLSSAGSGEGKSTVASNLGIAIAEVGQRVLLIDADLRSPRLHDIFGMNNDRGLSTILRENTSLNGDKSVGDLIQETDIPGLFVLTSGPVVSTATNLLCGSHTLKLLNHVRNEFDTVLIDTPPMLEMPDARVLGHMADKVILVIRAGQTTKDAIVAAGQRLNEDGTKILGTILNDWNPKSAPNGYYSPSSRYKYGHSHVNEIGGKSAS
jgi:succinoglycan biosynthesis transport protein ExoP